MQPTAWKRWRQPRIERELMRMTDVLQRLGADRVILFGEYARGDCRKTGSVDLLVVLDTKQRMADRIERVLEALDSEMTVEPLVYTPQEFERLKANGGPLIEAVEHEGRVLYERAT
ncbi:MAG: nucleotidyltransferase domain-containing protein [Phycisphaerales bacterium]|nr:MAG: nucleotidyltransferase domain-containing protein [Phycisphaerales bacterium]